MIDGRDSGPLIRIHLDSTPRLNRRSLPVTWVHDLGLFEVVQAWLSEVMFASDDLRFEREFKSPLTP